MALSMWLLFSCLASGFCTRIPGKEPDEDSSDVISASRQDCAMVDAASQEVDEDYTEIVFVRHALSLNNMFKESVARNVWSAAKLNGYQAFDLKGPSKAAEKNWKLSSASKFKSGYAKACHVQQLCGNYSEDNFSSINWELWRNSRDCLLHPEGEESSEQLGRSLSQLVPPDMRIDGFYASPLRRTLQTLLAVFGDIISHRPQSQVGIQPWAHEQYKSESDLANDGDMNANFLDRYVAHLDAEAIRQPLPSRAISSLQRGLNTLGKKWVREYGRAHPRGTGVDAPLSANDTDAEPFYPLSWASTYHESKAQLAQRMIILRRWLKQLPTGGRYVLVAHGGISKALFGRKLDNLGVAVARFHRDADTEDAKTFFSDVQLAREHWSCSKIPGWYK